MPKRSRSSATSIHGDSPSYLNAAQTAEDLAHKPPKQRRKSAPGSIPVPAADSIRHRDLDSSLRFSNHWPGPLRLLPQQTFDPAHNRKAKLELHKEPRGITDDFNESIKFDISGYPVGTGIRMSLLDGDMFATTREAIVDRDRSLEELLPKSLHSGAGIKLCIEWPTDPPTVGRFRTWTLLRLDGGGPKTRADLAYEIVQYFRGLLEKARQEVSQPSGSQVEGWDVGPHSATLEDLWLVSMFQMAARHYFTEVRVNVAEIKHALYPANTVVSGFYSGF